MRQLLCNGANNGLVVGGVRAAAPEWSGTAAFAFLGWSMKTRLSLKPGQKGTKRLTERFGESLLFVRYRYDEQRGIRLKTVELVVEQTPWQPAPRLKETDLVPVAVGYGEKELLQRLKAAKGRWDLQARHWLVPYGAVKGTELEARMPAEYRTGKAK